MTTINQLLWLIPFMLFTSLLLLIGIIDIISWCIPDHLNYLLLWLGLAFSVWPSFAVIDCRSALLGAIFGYLILWLFSLLFNLIYQKEGMGRGDFKLLAAIGAWIGWQMLVFTLFLASTLALIYIVVDSLYRKRIATIIPFAPFLSLAGWLSFIAHTAISHSIFF